MDRLQCQEELAKLIDTSMKNSELLTFDDFKEMTEHVSSTIYLCVHTIREYE